MFSTGFRSLSSTTAVQLYLYSLWLHCVCVFCSLGPKAQGRAARAARAATLHVQTNHSSSVTVELGWTHPGLALMHAAPYKHPLLPFLALQLHSLLLQASRPMCVGTPESHVLLATAASTVSTAAHRTRLSVEASAAAVTGAVSATCACLLVALPVGQSPATRAGSAWRTASAAGSQTRCATTSAVSEGTSVGWATA